MRHLPPDLPPAQWFHEQPVLGTTTVHDLTAVGTSVSVPTGTSSDLVLEPVPGIAAGGEHHLRSATRIRHLTRTTCR